MRVISTTRLHVRLLDRALHACASASAAAAARRRRRRERSSAVLLQLLRIVEASRAAACRACESALMLAPSRTVIVPSLLIEMSRSVGWNWIGPSSPRTWSPALVTSSPLRVDLQRAVAGVALAARRLHHQEAVAVDGDVERIAGLLDRALAEVVPGARGPARSSCGRSAPRKARALAAASGIPRTPRRRP